MKKLFIWICSVAMLGICSLVQAQVQDTASTDYNNQGTVEETQEDKQKGAEESSDAIQQDKQSTEEELKKDADEMEKNLEGSTIDKVGPNGEKLFMERGKYFYFDSEGDKKKVKKSKVRDKSEF